MDFGKAVRHARKARGLTLDELAAKVGSTQNNIWKLETQNKGGMDLLARVSTVVSLEWTGIARGRTLGVRVQTRRVRMGWSRTRLAAKAGVSVSAVGRVEADRGHIETLSSILDVLAPKIGWNHNPVRWGKLPGSRDCRFTPPNFLHEVEFVLGGDIDLDPCGHPDAAVRAHTVYTEADDGLARRWEGQRIFVNPPYSRAADWIRKSHRAWTEGAGRILLLVPAQTHTRAFHESVVPYADTFLLGFRLPFFTPENPVPTEAPFAMMVVVFGADEMLVHRAMSVWRCVHLAPAPRVDLAETARPNF